MKGSVNVDKSGKYYFVVDIGKDATGKRKQKMKRGFKTEELAMFALDNYLKYEINNDVQYTTLSTSTKRNDLKIIPTKKKIKSNKRQHINFNFEEKFIEQILINNLDLIEEGMKYIGNQIAVNGGFIDILARDSKGKLTIIEIKNNSQDDRISTQVIYYPSQFEETCRVIVIAPDYNEKTLYSLEQINKYIHPIELKQIKQKINKETNTYNLSFEVSDFKVSD